MKLKAKYIYYLLGFNMVLRLIMAICADLGVDESYYFTYALNPSLSYFDHPPMVGYLAWLSTLGGQLMHPFFVRLGSLVIGTVNIWLVYKIGEQILNKRAGFYAAMLFCASVYTSVMSSVFLMPDAPLSLFWLLSIYVAVRFIQTDNANLLYLFGVFAGLALLSKYHAVFLGVGMGLFILIEKREALRLPQLYWAVLISLVFLMPVLIWNFQHHFISFTFHGNRAEGVTLKPLMFLQDVSGQFAYNGFVAFVLAMVSLFTFFKRRKELATPETWLLFWISIPLWLFVIGLSFFNRTQAHWSGPAYFGFFILAGYVLEKYLTRKRKVFQKLPFWGLGIFALGTMVGVVHVNYGLVPPYKTDDYRRQGQYDFSLDMYGWKQIEQQLDAMIEVEKANGSINDNFQLITRTWVVGGQLSYHFSHSRNIKLYVCDGLNGAHNFYYTNEKLGKITEGSDAFFITASNYYRPIPEHLISQYEECTELPQLEIKRGNNTAFYVFVYRLNNAKTTFEMNKLNN